MRAAPSLYRARAHWKQIYSDEFKNKTIYEVEFGDSQKGWIIAGEDKYRTFLIATEDGGSRWEKVCLSAKGKYFRPTGLHIYDSKNIWLSGYDDRGLSFCFSTDGGERWTASHAGFNEVCSLENIVLLGPTRVIISVTGSYDASLGYEGHFNKYTQDGKTWYDIREFKGEYQDKDHYYLQWKCSIRDNNRRENKEVSESGSAFKSNKGLSKRSFSPDGNIAAKYHINDRDGWFIDISGDNAQLLHSEDGGLHYEVLVEGTKEQLLAKPHSGYSLWSDGSAEFNYMKRVFFTDKHNGWIVTPSAVLHTRDGGKTWVHEVEIALPSEFIENPGKFVKNRDAIKKLHCIKDFHVLSGKEAWISGTDGLLLKYTE